jgi:outer membrane protein W
MRSSISILITAGILLSSTSVASAGSLERRNQLELRFSAWTQATVSRTEISPGSVSTSVDASGLGGSLAYGHWLSEGWAFNISVGAMAAGVEVESGTGGVQTDTAVITQIFIGAKYYFPPSTYGSSVRPFLSASVGPSIGSQTRTETGSVVTVESRVETSFGGQLGAGIDFPVGRHFMIGASLGYNLMTDFDRRIGGSRNYSGPTFGIGLSYLFGKGTE